MIQTFFFYIILRVTNKQMLLYLGVDSLLRQLQSPREGEIGMVDELYLDIWNCTFYTFNVRASNVRQSPLFALYRFP